MDEKNAVSAMSSSLLARDVYCVCFSERDGLDSLRGELAQARKKFFTGGKKTVKVGTSEIIKGFDGRLQGKLSRRGFYWKKSTGKDGGRVALEEAFDQRTGHLLVKRDFRGVIVSRTFFDRENRWIKSEYYEPWDSLRARVTLKPSDASDSIEQFDSQPGGGLTRSTVLYPLPYLDGAAEQSILNARFGDPKLIVSTAEGQFCYCSRKEAELRKKALEEIQNGTIILMPAWEVKDGTLAGDEGEEKTRVTFTSLEEYARIEPPEAMEDISSSAVKIKSEEHSPAGPPALSEAEEFTPQYEAEKSQAPVEELAAEESSAKPEPAKPAEQNLETRKQETALQGMGYHGTIRDGKLTGRGRTEQQNGLTSYDGEFRNGKREGFGSYYYKDGSLCYSGFWKNDKKNGLGVSFRGTDHALHVAKWENGQPGGFVSLFDKDGNLRYGGRIENGKKQGAGVSFNQDDGTIFVGKWEDGKPTGLGSAFDREGNLLYYGGWHDGKRSGHGTEFDKNGGIVFDGEWKDGKYHNGILYQKLEQQDAAGNEEPQWDM